MSSNGSEPIQGASIPCYSTKRATNQFPGYGFKFIGGQRRKKKVMDPKERAIMARIVELRESGLSWFRIAVQFVKERLRTRDGVKWSEDRIRRAYIAELALRTAEPVETQCCGICGDYKERTAENFHKNAHEPHGFHRICKDCRNRQARDKTREERINAERRPFRLFQEGCGASIV